VKILIFTSQIHLLGGAEGLAVELAEELNKRPGIRADLLSMVSEDFPGTARTKERLLNSGVPSVQFLGRRPASGFVDLVPSIFKLRRILRRGDYHIVETSMTGPSILACWATIGTGTRHISGIHVPFSKERQNCIADRFFRLSMRSRPPAGIYAISDYVADQWAEFSSISREQIEVIYNSIAREYFCVEPESHQLRQDLGIPGNARIVLFAGRLVMSKGYEMVFRALAPVVEKYDIYLLFAGKPYVEGFFDDEEGLYERIKDQIDKACLNHRIRFLGWRNDIPSLLSIADVLVHPPMIEGFGLILAEALAYGLPIVASKVEGIPEVLEGTDSIMVPPQNPVALREGVVRVLYRTDQEAEQCLRKGKARAEFFRIERRADELIRLFSAVLAGRW